MYLLQIFNFNKLNLFTRCDQTHALQGQKVLIKREKTSVEVLKRGAAQSGK